MGNRRKSLDATKPGERALADERGAIERQVKEDTDSLRAEQEELLRQQTAREQEWQKREIQLAEQARQIKAERAGIESQDEGLKTQQAACQQEWNRLKAEEAEIARQQQHLQAQRAALTGLYREAADRFDNLCAKQDDFASQQEAWQQECREQERTWQNGSHRSRPKRRGLRPNK